MKLTLNASQVETLIRVLHGAIDNAKAEEVLDIKSILNSIYGKRNATRKHAMRVLYGNQAK